MNGKRQKIKKYKINMQTRRTLQAYTFISPFIIGLLVFFIFPIFVSVKLSFGRLVSLRGFVIEWAGVEQYIYAFTVDVNFVPMLLNVISSTLTRLPLILVFSLIIAIMINKNIRFKGLFRIIYFLPFLLGTGDVMRQLVSQQIDQQVLAAALPFILPRGLLQYMGAAVIEFVGSFFSMIVLSLWSSGVQILLFLSALQGITASLYESAKVDGATEWDVFWKITVPMVAPMMQLVIVYSILDSFTSQNNQVLNYIREQAFTTVGGGRFEYAAAIGWVYFTFIILLVTVVMSVMNVYIKHFEKVEVKRDDIY